jgi:hypothetical protein
MKNRISTIASFAFAFLAIAASFINSGSTLAKAADERPSVLVFRMLGIGRGQTARLNLLSFGQRNAVPVALQFVDMDGRTLAQSSVMLAPAHAGLLDLPFAERGDSNRLQFYAVVSFGQKPGPEGYMIPKLELVDNATGRTERVLANPEG